MIIVDKIFKFFTTESKFTNAYISWFVDSFPSSEFYGLDLVLYLFLEFCSKLNVEAKKPYLISFLDTDLRRIVKEENIRIDTLTSSFNYDEAAAFEQAVQVISTATVDKFEHLSSEPFEEDDNFKVLVVEWMQNSTKENLMTIFNKQFTELSSSGNASKVAEETSYEVSNLKDVYDIERKVSKLDFLTDTGSKKTTDVATLLSTTGIPAIDEDYGGLFSKSLFTYAGQPGSGKTRFLMACIVYRALVIHKVGVRMDELELADYEVKNMLVSIHIANLYGYKIADVWINRDTINDEQRKIVESARIDLFESGKYGRFCLSTDDLIVETMKSEVLSYFKHNKDIKIWCVDYTGIIKSKPQTKYGKQMIAAEIIEEALSIGKSIAKTADTCSVFVNQFNKEGNIAASNGVPITPGMVQGGQSIQRYSDYDLAITCTDEQKAANLRMFSTTKVRSAIGFNFVPVETNLAVSYYNQINKSEERG